MQKSVTPKEFFLEETQFKMLCLIQKNSGITSMKLLSLLPELKNIRSVTYASDKLHEKGLIKKELIKGSNKNTFSIEKGVKIENE